MGIDDIDGIKAMQTGNHLGGFMGLDSARQLEIVCALAEHRNFHRAAKALGMTQPSLTRSLKTLEGHLGVQLFDRDGQVRPTAFGRILLERGRPLLSGFAELAREITLAKGLDIGELRISAGPYPTAISAHRALGRVIANHPGLTIDLLATDPMGATEDVLEGRSDLAFAELSEVAEHPDLETELIRCSELRIFCRSGHPLAGEASLTAEQVAVYPIVGSSYSRRLLGAEPSLRTVARPDDRGRFRPRIRVDTVAGFIDIVASSDAICGIVPALIQRQLDEGVFMLLPLRLPNLRLNYGFIWRRGRSHSPAALAFMESVREIERSIPD